MLFYYLERFTNIVHVPDTEKNKTRILSNFRIRPTRLQGSRSATASLSGHCAVIVGVIRAAQDCCLYLELSRHAKSP